MLDNGRNTILSLPFGNLSGEVSPVLPFLCLRFERLVVVRVDGSGISDSLGCDRYGTVVLAMVTVIALVTAVKSLPKKL